MINCKLLIIFYCCLTTGDSKLEGVEEFHRNSVVESNIKEQVRPRIIGGTNVTSMTETPYQVAIHYYECMCHQCGGAIISKRHVLTAAHCLYVQNIEHDEEAFYVMVGIINPDSDKNAIKKSVRYVFPHSDFTLEGPVNDIAVIKIVGYFEYSATVKKIGLTNEIIRAGQTCKVAGWGQTDPVDRNSLSKTLQFLEIEIIDRKICNQHHQGRIRDGMICAGKMEDSKSPCHGDSGSPLICNNKITGITSWGDKCGAPNQPVVFTDVYKYRKWIVDQTGVHISIFFNYSNSSIVSSSSHKICLNLYLLLIQFGLFIIFDWQ